MPHRKIHDVAVLVYDGLCTFEFGVAVEVFGLPRPELGRDWYRFNVVSLDGGYLRATGGVSIRSRAGLEQLSRAGTIIIPGWKGVDVQPPPRLISVLRKAHARQGRLVSLCSGVFVLAATGLLDGRRATTHWRYVDAFRARYPKVQVEPNVLFVDSNRILSSAGSAAAIDLCLHIVRKDFGAEVANQVARRLVVSPQRDGGQAQFIQEPMPKISGGRLVSLIEWLESNFHRQLSIPQMARQAAMSSRSFARKFRMQTGSTPYQWLTRLRLLAAQRRLEQKEESVDEIAQAVGWDTAATLRQHFARHLGTTPTSYRRQFSTKRRPAMNAA